MNHLLQIHVDSNQTAEDFQEANAWKSRMNVQSLIKHYLLHWNKCNNLHKNWFMNDLNSFWLIFNEWGPLTTLPLCKWLDHLVYFSDLKTNRNSVQHEQSLRKKKKKKTHDLNAFSCDFA